MPSELCSEEIETLLAIFLDDITIDYATEDVIVTMILYPSTGDDSESKYVTFTLELTLSPVYPDVQPEIKFRNPRGLSEDMLLNLEKKMHKKCQEILGCSMIFELIDMGKEFLTANNRPSQECPICLLSFTEFDVFFRPSCFHHVHSYCLGKYLYSIANSASGDGDENTQKEVVIKYCCPVCRNELKEDINVDKLLSSPPPSEESQEALLSTKVPEAWLGKRESLNLLYAKQKSQGGIIDLANKKIHVISIRGPQDSGDGNEPTGGSQEENSNSSSSVPQPPAQVSGNTSSHHQKPRIKAAGHHQS